MRYLLIFSFFLFISMTFLSALDEITMKSGEIVKGKLDDKQETATELKIDVSTMKGISDFKTILKSEIESVKKSDGAEDPATQLVAPEDSVEIKWYEEQIEKSLKPWIAKYPQSPLLPQVQQKLTDLEAERDRVKAGDIKMGGRWFTRSEFEEVKIDVDALKYLEQVKDLVDRKDYNELLKVKSKITIYKTSDHLDKIANTFLAGFKDFQTGGYEDIIRKQITDLEFSISQNEKFIGEIVNQPIPPISFANDDVVEWDALRSNGLLEAAKRAVGNQKYQEFKFVDENRYYVRFNGTLYRVTDVLAEWNKSDSVIDEFIKDFKKYYLDPNAPKYRISTSKMAEARRMLAAVTEGKDKIKSVKKDSESIGQFEGKINSATAEIEGLKLQNFDRAKESVKAATLAHEQRDFNVTVSELRTGSQTWPGLISLDRAVKKMATDYFMDAKEDVKKGDLEKASKELKSALELIPLAKAKFISLVTLKTDINKFMADNAQMIELAKKQEAEAKKKEQDQKTFSAKFESDFNRGDYLAVSKLDVGIMEGTENYQSYVDRKKKAETGVIESKDLMQQVRPFLVAKKLNEAGDALAKAKNSWPLNPGLGELNGLLAEAMKPKTIFDTMEEHMGITIGAFLAIFLGAAYGVSRYLAK